MPFRLLMIAALGLSPLPLAAQDTPDPAEHLVLPADHIITVTVDGMPLRLLVTAEANGPARVNPAIAVYLGWQSEFEMLWNFGRDAPLRSEGLTRVVDFGGSQRTIPVIWSTSPVNDEADGTIGIHHLPHKRVTFPLGTPVGEQRVQIFPLKRIGSARASTLGTELDAEGKTFRVFFVHELAENLLTAPTANFLATRFKGGFLPGSEGEVAIDFSIRRQTRMMRLERPLALGDLRLDRFAVRYEDFGRANAVGMIGENDPGFAPDEIVVVDRQRRDRPDFLTRIGRNQIAHCSSLTYDLAQREIRLTCGPKAG